MLQVEAYQRMENFPEGKLIAAPPEGMSLAVVQGEPKPIPRRLKGFSASIAGVLRQSCGPAMQVLYRSLLTEQHQWGNIRTARNGKIASEHLSDWRGLILSSPTTHSPPISTLTTQSDHFS